MQTQTGIVHQMTETNRRIWDINTELGVQMANTWIDEIQSLMKLNAEHLQTLSKAQAPTDLAAANWEFGRHYAQKVGEATRTRFSLLTSAARDTSNALAEASKEPMDTIYKAAAKASDTVDDQAEQVRADVEDVIEADLERIDGIGPAFAAELRKNGVVSVGHVANLRLEDIEHDQHPLNSMLGHIENGRWIDQAKALLDARKAA